ncbi:hypothetical protein [Pontivivens nitratireducens]|uniref:hypothetical protein n=1 Tax=Pontivivens nitratireducens TaxID=2758038 RepID=UPI00163B5DD4|nr:hypothetical protein [Pontibrevibacter nitratireducens]
MLALYWEPDLDEATRINSYGEFVRALSRFPEWAMQKAFDRWVDTQSRRPSPADIAHLASVEILVLRREIDARRGGPPVAPVRRRMTPDQARAVVQDCGLRMNEFGKIIGLGGDDLEERA